MQLFRTQKKQVPAEAIDRWHRAIFENMGITGTTDHATIREAVRRILMESARLLEEMDRAEAGMKPLKK